MRRTFAAQNDYMATFIGSREEGLVGMATTQAGAHRLVHDFICDHFPLESIFRFEIKAWVNLPSGDFGGCWQLVKTIPVTASMRKHPRSGRRDSQGGEDDGQAA